MAKELWRGLRGIPWHCINGCFYQIRVFKKTEKATKISKRKSHFVLTIQLNEYETAPYFIQFSQNLTCDCLFISVFCPKFTWAEPKIGLNIRTEQFQAQVNLGQNTEINKKSHVKFWLNWIKYGAVSYSLSCTEIFVVKKICPFSLFVLACLAWLCL